MVNSCLFNPISADLYFSCIQKPHVTFLDASHPGEALASVDETGVNTSGGKHIDADVIIYATGFHVHKYLRGLSIKGRDGKDIQDLWADEEPKNWMGITVAGFPNLFISLGPRGLLGYQSAIFSVECQVEYAIESIKQCLKYGYKTIEVTQKAQEEFIDWYDKKMSQLLWSAPIKVGLGVAKEEAVAVWVCCLAASAPLRLPSSDFLTVFCPSRGVEVTTRTISANPSPSSPEGMSAGTCALRSILTRLSNPLHSGSLYYWMCRKVDWSKVKVTPGRSKTWFFSWSDTAKYALFLAVLAYAWKKYGKK